MKPLKVLPSLLLLGLLAAPSAGAAGEIADLLDRAIASPQRSPAYKARDRYRHPKETLLFFRLRPDLHVVEVWPGAGYYTEILAPILRAPGRYYAAHYYVDDRASAYFREARQGFLQKLSKQPELYDRVVVTALEAPEHVTAAPKESVDLVLTFRNVHNWMAAGNDQAMFRAFYSVLKPAGVLGVVEHRAREGTAPEEMKRSGYITEAYVVGLAEKAGFKVAARSEINANPMDTKDYPAGVWALPPTLRLGSVDREKYITIGESDRMTLKFVKR
jgi:predicted methyltransferase